MSHTLKVPYAKYVALPSWDGQQWAIRVEDYDYIHRGDTTARRLDQVAYATSVLLAFQFGCHPSHMRVSVEPCLATEIDDALDRAAAHSGHPASEIKAVAAALRQANMCRHDIALLLAERGVQQAPSRPLLIGNTEIAGEGLHHWPDVTAVELPDGDVEVTRCRICVERDVRWWREHPDATSAAIYDEPVSCDICGRDVDQRAS
jgi:hypothetical protein